MSDLARLIVKYPIFFALGYSLYLENFAIPVLLTNSTLDVLHTEINFKFDSDWGSLEKYHHKVDRHSADTKKLSLTLFLMNWHLKEFSA